MVVLHRKCELLGLVANVLFKAGYVCFSSGFAKRHRLEEPVKNPTNLHFVSVVCGDTWKAERGVHG